MTEIVYKNQDDSRSPSSKLLPKVERDPGASAEDLSKRMQEAIDKSNVFIISQLDRFIEELEEIKRMMVDHGAFAKATLSGHFNLGAEGLRECDRLSKKMQDLVRDAFNAPPQAAPAAAANGRGDRDPGGDVDPGGEGA